MAASSPARHTAQETQPADPRRLQYSRTPTDDAHQPTTLAERRRARIRINCKRNCGARSSHGPAAAQTQASRRRPRLARPRRKQSGAERIRTAATDKYEVIDHETR